MRNLEVKINKNMVSIIYYWKCLNVEEAVFVGEVNGLGRLMMV